ncbi:MAG: M20/M25/M40 family metallo-hydrolase [Planctomycetaceae bacterium]
MSATVITGLAIADLQKNGWHGKIVKGKQQGTSNIGSIRGGDATNVVTDRLAITAEVRSHQPAFRKQIIKAYEKAFRLAAKSVKNAQGQTGRIRFSTYDKYESFRLSPKEPSVRAAMEAIESIGLPAMTRVIDGGLDANWMTAHGFPTVTLGCGQAGIHTVNESLNIPDYLTPAASLCVSRLHEFPGESLSWQVSGESLKLSGNPELLRFHRSADGTGRVYT